MTLSSIQREVKVEETPKKKTHERPASVQVLPKHSVYKIILQDDHFRQRILKNAKLLKYLVSFVDIQNPIISKLKPNEENIIYPIKRAIHIFQKNGKPLIG